MKRKMAEKGNLKKHTLKYSRTMRSILNSKYKQPLNETVTETATTSYIYLDVQF